MTLSMSYGKFYSLSRGFSLIEMAIVLVILGALLGGMLMPLSSQREFSQRQAVERQLQEIRNALIGFAQANNRLPCPATQGNGDVIPTVGVPPIVCPTAASTATYVPYAELGIQGTVINGDLVDVWQQPIRYRLANPSPVNWLYANSPIPTSPATATTTPYFQICDTAGACPSAGVNLISGSIVAVVLSTGDNDHTDSIGEAQNKSSTPTVNDFVQRTLEQNFNDIIVSISHPALVFELSRSGQ